MTSKAWHAANPGVVSGIKSIDYLREAAARAAGTADEGEFRAYDLNCADCPTPAESALSVSQWLACEASPADLPPREGRAVLGIDLGASASMTAAACFWFDTGRLETLAAFPSWPDLGDRGRTDAVGTLYEAMAAAGELVQAPGRIVDPAWWVRHVSVWLGDAKVHGLASDSFKRQALAGGIAEAGLAWPIQWRGAKASDNGADLRAFRECALSGRIRSPESLLMKFALGGSSVQTDAYGNETLGKAKAAARIDALSAAVLAAGLAERLRTRPQSRRALSGRYDKA